MTRHDAGPAFGAHRAEPRASMNLEAMLEASRKGMAAATEAQARMLLQVAEMGGEMLRFAGQRVEQDRLAAQRLVECRTPQDVFQAYGDFLRDAARQYSEEMGQLSAICGEQTRATMEMATAFSQSLRQPQRAPGAA